MKFRPPTGNGERNFVPQINCSAKFCFRKRNFVQNLAYPSEILSEIALSAEQNAMRNFARLYEISMIWEQ